MLGVVIPAHNEQETIGDCIDAARIALAHRDLLGEAGCVIVVADQCTDATADIARDRGANVLTIDARNVGAARAAGAQYLLSRGGRWLAFTDADSRVAPDWLVQQLALNADAVCGVVSIDDWSAHVDETRLRFDQAYFPADGHRHIHGANLGVSAQAYLLAGGFRPLCTSEDVALIEALQRSGARLAWSAAPKVTTSARKDFRAPGGFGATLLQLSAEAPFAEDPL